MSVWRDTFVPLLAPRVAYLYIKLLRLTMRLTWENREVLEQARRKHGHYILAFWHSRLVMMPYVYPGPRIVVMSSRHRDSRMLSEVLRRFGIEQAWGSTTSGAVPAIRDVLRRVRTGCDVGITPDGPRGPRRRAKPGMVAIARMTGLPVIPVAFSALPARRLGSWDHTLVPYPFSRGMFVYGEPVVVPRDLDEAGQERMRMAIEAEIDRLTDATDARVGLAVEEPRPAVEV